MAAVLVKPASRCPPAFPVASLAAGQVLLLRLCAAAATEVVLTALPAPCPPCSYMLYAFACFVERTWRFGLPLVLAFVEGGFQVGGLGPNIES